MKTLLVFATPKENPFGDGLPKSTEVLITGIGKLNAALGLSRVLQKKKMDRVLNLGICGSVVPRFAVGNLVAIKTVIEGDRDSFGEPLTLSLPLTDSRFPQGILVTQDRAVKTQSQKKQVLSLGGELVDMEAFALAKVSKVFEIPFYCWKVVSDRVSLQSSKTIRENISYCAQKLLQHTEDFF